ncbi:Multiple coagulation factor deficiency protein 2 [Strongyloides ratti]|uniref:Multiple coagulation factor deficiency protein 2 n=1 Tax=Strongyloides ratti TaxID=34506 RepID=A0A090KZX6_STRRB|nr:Multiple coagulation factor deficiency protein 2 [Strongyloides ratti]CEF62981.1 Multiple coagulation factor deficiency protein 2 [Strongyloides ratti]
MSFYLYIIILCLSIIYTNSSQTLKQFHNKKDLKEHLQNLINVDNTEWSKDQEIFYNFKMYDSNDDFYLDGKEIIDEFINHNHNIDTTALPTDEALEILVDDILKESDLNNDGLISYSEYHILMLKK